MTATAVFRETGLMPHLRDAVRSLIGATHDADTTWQLGEGEIVDALALMGEMRQLIDVAEVAMVREGLERGLPAQEAWSPHDWVTRRGVRRRRLHPGGMSPRCSGWRRGSPASPR